MAAVALTLRGDGRLVHLGPRTVRAALSRFIAVNGLGPRDRKVFDRPIVDHRPAPGILDRALGASRDRRPLTGSEIDHLSAWIDRLIITRGLSLHSGENEILDGLAPSSSLTAAWRQRRYAVRHGLVLAVRPLSPGELLRGCRRDLLLRSDERELTLVRYDGLATDGAVTVRLRHRLDLNRDLSMPLASLSDPSVVLDLWAVEEALPCRGYHVGEWGGGLVR